MNIFSNDIYACSDFEIEAKRGCIAEFAFTVRFSYMCVHLQVFILSTHIVHKSVGGDIMDTLDKQLPRAAKIKESKSEDSVRGT